MITNLITRMAWYYLAVVVVFGCAKATPHENFVNFLNYQVGKKWTWLRDHHQFPAEKTLISSKELPNGNIEKKYQGNIGLKKRGPCIRIYEIDPKTDIIIRADFEGSDEDCVIVP